MSATDSIVEYRELPAYPGYRVGNDGTIHSCRPINGRGPLKTSWRQLKNGSKDKNGYFRVSLCKGAGRSVFLKIHHLVLYAFVGPKPKGMEACHGDGNPENNKLSNLRWDTRRNNAIDSTAHGTQVRGEKSGMSKLTEEDVEAIRRDYLRGKNGYRPLAKKYGVRPWVIFCIIRRLTWKHVK